MTADSPDFQLTVKAGVMSTADSPDWQTTLLLVPSVHGDAPDWQQVAVGPGGSSLCPGFGFGTPVGNTVTDVAVTVSLTGVVSGQPIAIISATLAYNVTMTVADTFSTPYSWASLGYVEPGNPNNFVMQMFWGTGGAGTSGDVTVTVDSPPGARGMAMVAFPCVNANNLLDAHLLANGSVNVNPAVSTTVTPIRAGSGIIACALGNGLFTTTESSPWVDESQTMIAAVTLGIATYLAPPVGSPQYASWMQAVTNWACGGAMVIAPA